MRISDWSSDVCSSDLVSDLELDMRFSIRSIDREFSPAEAAEITGVSTALQRAWRRRGILPENADGNWTRWDFNDIIKLCVMKLFRSEERRLGNACVFTFISRCSPFLLQKSFFF